MLKYLRERLNSVLSMNEEREDRGGRGVEGCWERGKKKLENGFADK